MTYNHHLWSNYQVLSDLLLLFPCSGPGGGGGDEEQGGEGGPTAADQPLDHRSEPLDRLGSDTQQPGGAAKEHRRLSGQRSHLCQNAWTKVQV